VAQDLIDVPHLLRRVLDMHGATGVDVEVLPGAPASIRGDRRRLAQALGNIAANAALYAGGLTEVTVSAPRDGWLRVALDDAGQGIGSEERDAIFGRFARGVAGVAAGTTSGSGLGLALTGEHVRLHGGGVWVEDAPGGGARLVVELPVGDP
jgi:signal transduction histidine kinase